MFAANGIVPTRFLILIAHFCVIVNLLWSSQETLAICHPSATDQLTAQVQQSQLTVGLCIAIGMICFEMVIFLSGITMFHSTSSLISISAHSFATVLLTYFVIDSWECNWYWIVFSVCPVIPTLIDSYAAISFICSNLYFL